MRKPTLIFLAGALAAAAALAQGSPGDGGTKPQFGSVVGVPPIWPTSADGGTQPSRPDAGDPLKINW